MRAILGVAMKGRQAQLVINNRVRIRLTPPRTIIIAPIFYDKYLRCAKKTTDDNNCVAIKQRNFPEAQEQIAKLCEVLAEYADRMERINTLAGKK